MAYLKEKEPQCEIHATQPTRRMDALHLLEMMRAATFRSVPYAGTSSHYFYRVSSVSKTTEGVSIQLLLFPSLPQIWGLAEADSVGRRIIA